MAASTYFNQVQQLYIAYFGRPADPVGLNFWAQNIDAAGGNIDGAIAGFSSSAESTALYGGKDTSQLVTSIYLALFNRYPEPTGLAFWVGQIDSNTITGARAAYQILTSAAPGDAVPIANKVAAANAFTNNIDTSAELAGYSGASSAAGARAWLAKVDATPYSIANLASDVTKGVADATGIQPSVPTAPADPAFSAILTAGAVAFSGIATGDISVSWSGLVGTSVATFARGGNFSDAINFGVGGASSITLGATDNLIGSASTLANLTTTGAGAVKLTDTALNLAGKVFAANSTNDVLTLTTSATATTSLANLTGFEAVHLAGSSAVITIANGAGTAVDTTAAVSVQLGSGGQTFVGSAGADTIRGGAGADTLTGGGGVDTFLYDAANRSTLANMDTITDFRAAGGANNGAADIITISDIQTVVAGGFGPVFDANVPTLITALNGLAQIGATNNGLMIFKWSGDTYIYIETTGTATTYVASDTVIKLSGLPFGSVISHSGLGIDGV